MSSSPLDDALGAADLDRDPFASFARWYARAMRECPGVADMTTLATATRDGRPSARLVLLKGYGPAGFTFGTNYGSRKALELDENPRAALVLHWPALARQVRIEGGATRLGPEESDEMFRRRPRESRLAAIASPQSRPIPDRAWLVRQYDDVARRHEGGDVPRPEGWGGYRVVAEWIEFWIGGAHRMHDRFAYTRREDGGWRIERLAP